MKKICILLLISITALLIGQGCATEQKNLSDCSIGVIETNGYSDNSRVIFYDKNMQEKEQVKISYSSVGNIFYDPCIYENNLYIIPQGKSHLKDEKKVLEINLKDLSKKCIKSINLL